MLMKARTFLSLLVAGAVLALPVMEAKAAPLPMSAAGVAGPDPVTEVAQRYRYGRGHYRPAARAYAPRRYYRANRDAAIAAGVAVGA